MIRGGVNMFGKASRGLDSIDFTTADKNGSDFLILSKEMGISAEVEMQGRMLKAFKEPQKAMNDFIDAQNVVIRDALAEYRRAGNAASALYLPEGECRKHAAKAAANTYHTRMELIYRAYPWASSAEELIEVAGGSIPGKKKAKKGIPAGNKQPEEQ